MAFGSSFAGLIGGAGGGNVIGGAAVRLLLDAAQFEAGLKGAQGRMMTLGRGMTRFGGALTKGLTVPVVAAAGASVKMAMDYEQAFTRIDALSNTSAENLKKWKGEVLTLATETGKAPAELAEALFFLSSAGLDAGQVMEALEASARASATGMGEMTDIAKLTANVLNVYGKKGMTATKATDTLAAAIKAGSAEPEEFASNMGKLLPIASKAGVSFEELAASMAVMSNAGLDINEGATAMRGLLAALVAPTSLAAETMKDFGISTDEMRRTLSEEGILGALRLLKERTNDNIDAQKKIIPNIRALTGAFNLTEQEAKKVNAIFRDVVGATGDVDEAFKKTEKDSAHKFQVALAELKVAAIKVGQILLPVITDVVKTVGELVKKFSDMSPKAKEFWVKLVLIGAALGPVLGLLGGIVRIAAPVVGAFTKMAGAAATTATATKAAGTAGVAASAATVGPLAVWTTGLLAVAGGAVAAYRANKDLLAQDLAGKFHESAEGIRFMAIASVEAGQGQRALFNILDQVTGLTKDQELQIAAMVETLHKWGGGLTQNQRHMINNLLVLGDYNGALKLLKGFLNDTIGPLAKNRKGIDDTKGAAADADQKVKGLGQKLKDLPAETKTKVTADVSNATAMLNALQDKYRLIKNEIENTIHVRVVPGDLGPLKPSGGGGAGSAQQLGIRAPAFALAPATGGTTKVLAVNFNAPVYGMADFRSAVTKAITEEASKYAGV